MPWFKVDDSFWGHPKRVACPPAALGLWVTAGSWCGQQLTDGHVPKHMLSVLGGKPKDAAALVSAGLWEEDRNIGGWWFHDWTAWQPPAAKVRENRAQEAARKANYRAKRAAGHELQSPPPDEDVPPDVPPGQPQDVLPGLHPGHDTDVRRDKPGTRARVPTRTGPDPTRPDQRTSEPADAGSAPVGAQALVAEWIDHCDARPPDRVVGHVAREVGAMLAEGIPAADVRAGLVAWHHKNLSPATLAAVVHETRTGRGRRSTADERGQRAQSLRAKYAAMDAAEATGLATITPLAIEGAPA